MAKERIISGESTSPVEEAVNLSLRPTTMADYVGQTKLRKKLSIALSAVKQRDEPMEHVLLHGPPGLGKTTLSYVIANEMGTHLTVTAGPALGRGSDLVGTLTKLQRHDVLFIDEIHRLPMALAEYLYSAMEDFKIEFVVDSGMHAKTITLPIQPFTLIGATTRAGLLTGPMRSRFGITHRLDFYSTEDLLDILRRSASLLKMPSIHDKTLGAIASRSRGTPRIANRLLRRVRDYAQIECDGRLDETTVDAALELEGIDALGIDDLDRQYLQTIADIYEGGPVGLEAIAATLSEDVGTLEDMVEPYLLQIGFLARTRRGRQLTAAAIDHMKLDLKLSESSQTDVESE
jgi:Holliday junction DNA helicase RuvB